MIEPYECIDIGSEYCPCYLAESNDCITCSILQGKEFCECNWMGVCVYHEFKCNGYEKKQVRNNFTSNIIVKKRIADNIYILKLKVTKTIARQLKEPGAYIFIRAENSEQYFDIPMSVMYADDIEDFIIVAYKVLGPKTKKLNESNKNILIRGPYWNGAFGLKNLKLVRNKNCLVIARGIAQAPAVLVIEKLVKNNNNVFLLIDKGSAKKNFISDYIRNLNIKVLEENVLSIKGKHIIKDMLINEDIDLVYSGGSDILHYQIIKILDELSLDPLIVATNNNEICCGEGICGACSTYLNDGTVIKACKTQIEVRDIFSRRFMHNE